MAQTLAEYWMQKGEAEGRVEGMKEARLLLAKNLCAAKLNPSLIARATELPMREIVALWFEVKAETAELQQ